MERHVPRRIRLPDVLVSRGRDRHPGVDADIESSETYAARLARILDPDATRATSQRSEPSDTISSEREKSAGH